jgi:integrase
MALTDSAIKTAKPKAKAYRISDSSGLYLEVSPAGGKLWRMKYRFLGKEKRIALGKYPEVSLKDARESRDAARKLLATGTDPSVTRKAAKAAALEHSAHTFEVIARQWFAIRSSKWVSNHSDKVINRLQRDIFPWLGSKPIKSITRAEIISTLNRIVSRGAIESARRAGFNLAQIFQYAIDNELADRNPAANLSNTLPSPQIKHRAAITEIKDIGGLLRSIDSYSGSLVTRCALKLAPLVFVRPIELRSAEWSEIDFKLARWTIPSQKMKMKESHIVPLSRQSLEILQELYPLTGNGIYVFPCAHNPKRPMSNNAVLSALRRMGYEKDDMTGHGFRAMARTVLDEVLQFRPDFIEHQLAHAVRDPNGRAYNRTTHLAERTKMMQIWANYLDSIKC